jgi:hypothetical protein
LRERGSQKPPENASFCRWQGEFKPEIGIQGVHDFGPKKCASRVNRSGDELEWEIRLEYWIYIYLGKSFMLNSTESFSTHE